MTKGLHSIELEQNGKVFATFRNESEYDEYLGDLAVDYQDGDFEMPENYEVWYCVISNDGMASITEEQYRSFKKEEVK